MPDEVYTQTDVDNLLTGYYTKAQIDTLLAAKQDKTVTPPVVPPPVGNVTKIDRLSVLSGAFKPQWQSPVTAGATPPSAFSVDSSGVWSIACADNAPTQWDATEKDVLAQYAFGDPRGVHDVWTFDVMLPTQKLIQQWHCGVLWELHTDTSSGHNLALNQDGTFRAVRQSGVITAATPYVFYQGPKVRWGQWIPIIFETKWSNGSDGLLKITIDGQLIVTYTGATAFANDGNPYLQFGWYSMLGAGITNYSNFRNMQRTVL